VRIDQWTPDLRRGDAIGDSILRMRDAFRAWGHDSHVYSLTWSEDVAGEARPFADWRPGDSRDVVILHYALVSPLTAALREHRGRRVLIHHNVTPGEFFDGWDPELARICREGSEQLAGLRDHVDLALGDSEFNRRQLEGLGFRRSGVLPIFLDFDRYRRQPANPVLLRTLRDGMTNLLFVGRVAPNKRHDDLVRVAAYWKRFIGPGVRLVLAGSLPRRETGEGRPLPRHYLDGLQSFFYEEGFTPAEVLFLGHVDHAELVACYRAAHVFLSMSEHEGFGVPLLEAMLLDVPVLAYRATAVPDTLAGAGLQFSRKSIAEVAETAQLLAGDAALRATVLEGQRRRLAAFEPAAVEARLRGYLESL
jgi:glycosyltransferase involved in cell wall biosynthesis